MKVLAAYLLLALGGKEKPSADDVKQFLTKIGVEHEPSGEIDDLVKVMENKTIDEVLEEGNKKLLASANATSVPAPVPASVKDPKDNPKSQPSDKTEIIDVDLNINEGFFADSGKY